MTIRNKNPSLKSYQVGENGSGKTTLVSSYIPKAHSYKEGFNPVMFWLIDLGDIVKHNVYTIRTTAA